MSAGPFQPIVPVAVSARSCREAIQRAARLTAALEAIRAHRPAAGDDIGDYRNDVEAMASAALEEQP